MGGRLVKQMCPVDAALSRVYARANDIVVQFPKVAVFSFLWGSWKELLSCRVLPRDRFGRPLQCTYTPELLFWRLRSGVRTCISKLKCFISERNASPRRYEPIVSRIVQTPVARPLHVSLFHLAHRFADRCSRGGPRPRARSHARNYNVVNDFWFPSPAPPPSSADNSTTTKTAAGATTARSRTTARCPPGEVT